MSLYYLESSESESEWYPSLPLLLLGLIDGLLIDPMIPMTASHPFAKFISNPAAGL